jgi:hypothetical protein
MHDVFPSLLPLTSNSCDECFKSAAYIRDYLDDKEGCLADEPTITPFNLAYKFSSRMWDWISDPSREMYRVRFNTAMKVTEQMSPPQTIVDPRKAGLSDPEFFSHIFGRLPLALAEEGRRCG